MNIDWFTADRVQVAFYVAALVIAVVRLVIIWTIGWRSYSGKGTVVVRLTNRGHELDRQSGPRQDDERLEYAVSCPTHSSAHRSPTMPEAMSYLALEHLAVIPDQSGTRNWNYRVVTGERLGWLRWTWRCLRLATVRRFREPDIGTCPGC